MMMKCPVCGDEVPDHERMCPTCGHDCGYPNVRAANRPVETAALSERYATAIAAAAAAGTESGVARFEQLVSGSGAAHAVKTEVLLRIANSENQFITSFYRQLGSGSRSPEDNEFDPFRQVVDARMFPYYHENILFAALTLTGHGVHKYGAYSLLLKDVAIRNRATVFEEDSFRFARRHELRSQDPLPSGFRASWDRRQVLAVAKLFGSIRKDMTDNELCALLLIPGENQNDDDFIEVHVHGVLSVRSIERVVGTRASTKAEKAIQKTIRTALNKGGVPLTVE